jgi:hypothetical protein
MKTGRTNRYEGVVISFADDAFKKRVSAFVENVSAFGGFEIVKVFNFSDHDAGFRQARGHYMQSTARGFEYWIWKPEIISSALDALEPDDILVYMDAGFTLTPRGRWRFQEYIDLTLAHPTHMLSFQNVHTEGLWTKGNLMQRLEMNLSSSEVKTSQLGSGLIFLQKTKSNADLDREWKNIAVEDHCHLSEDPPSHAPNHPKFQEHRHDRSIASLLRKQRGTAVTYYEVKS